MWTFVARLILRNRIAFLAILAAITAFMGYKASFVEMSYEYAKMLPANDTSYKEHLYFKKIFGEESNTFVIGFQDSNLFSLEKFNNYKKFESEVKTLNGVTGILSVGSTINLTKNKELKQFEVEEIFDTIFSSQSELDKQVNILKNLPFYKNLLFNDTSKVYLTAITLSKDILNSKERIHLINNITDSFEKFSDKYSITPHYSGLPYIRTQISQKIKDEIKLFTILALIVSIIVLFLFFRSFKVVFFSALIVGIGVVWAVGTIVLFDFRITILTGMIPPLLIVIGIPNSIFLLNKYHSEYKRHGNKIKALQRVIHKIGNAIFLTNLTTAAGFGTFIITSSDILREFGIIASINIMGVFVLALLLIPIIFSFLKPPKRRHIKHLEYKGVNYLLEKLVYVTLNHRKTVYIIAIGIFVVGLVGISQMKSTGYMVDDLPKKDPIYLDLKFFEKNFSGVMPFEVLIDTKRKNGVLQLSNLKKIDRLQKSIKKYDEFSAPLSIVSAAKFARQSFYNGNERQYKLPDNMNKNFIFSYISKLDNNENMLNSYLDSSNQITRVSFQVADIGTVKMQEITEKIRADVNSIFSPEKYDVILTGTSVIFFKGTTYLIKNLFISLALAIFLIAVFMAWMFSSYKMVIVSLLPNFIPLIFTAALMGFLGIPVKPSTILVFSIAFGISVDNTIHFLAKYRQELEVFKWDIKLSVEAALREAGVSMIYTSIVLFFGFGIFALSSFGGTSALGMLVSITLFFAMLANLVFLPSLLLSLQKSITIKAFEDPLLEVYDEEEDIDLEELRIDPETKVFDEITSNRD
jgi:uncharacterized protein